MVGAIILAALWIGVGIVARASVSMVYGVPQMRLRFVIAEVLGWPMVIALALWGSEFEE